MATYGKRKKGLLSSFTVFRDDTVEEDGSSQRDSTRERLSKAKKGMQRPRSRNRLDESSGDELGEHTSPYGVPKQPMRLPSLNRLGAMSTDEIIRPKSSNSIVPMTEDADKPLPPVPHNSFSTAQSQHQTDRPALAQKTTNRKISKGGAKRGARLKISPPVLQKTSNTAVHALMPEVSSAHPTIQDASRARTSLSDAADLSRKISKLMDEAKVQEEQTRRKEDIYALESAKLSALEKSKIALVKATQAIKSRLNSSSHEPLPINRRPVANRHSSYQELASPGPSLKYGFDQDISRGRLDRRIAEGENLSNPKIRSLTGDGHITRKPLPVYESMRSRSQRSASADDPFTDSKQLESTSPTDDYSGFDFDLNKNKLIRVGEPDQTFQMSHEARDFMEGVSSVTEKQSGKVQPQTRFSNMVSGLAQHPDTTLFSSPPLGHSTPRTRLETADGTDGDSKARLSLEPHSPLLELSHKDRQKDASSDPGSPKHHKARVSDGSNLSVKRKGGTEDLRAHQTPPMKRSRTGSGSPEDGLGLTAGIRGLETGHERVPLSPRSANMKGLKSDRNADKRKGVSIFDLGKGKAPERREDGRSTPTNRWDHRKRSSITMPSSMLFSRGRELREHRYTQMDPDSMDVDELQQNDAAYHVGTNMR